MVLFVSVVLESSERWLGVILLISLFVFVRLLIVMIVVMGIMISVIIIISFWMMLVSDVLRNLLKSVYVRVIFVISSILVRQLLLKEFLKKIFLVIMFEEMQRVKNMRMMMLEIMCSSCVVLWRWFLKKFGIVIEFWEICV